MSAGAITQLIASGGNASYIAPITSNSTYHPQNTSSAPLQTYVCLNDMCLVNEPSKFGNRPAFGSLDECQKVCGIKPSSRRPQ